MNFQKFFKLHFLKYGGQCLITVGTLRGEVERHNIHDKQAGSWCHRWNGNALAFSAFFGYGS
jgi:hypothetical protein